MKHWTVEYLSKSSIVWMKLTWTIKRKKYAKLCQKRKQRRQKDSFRFWVHPKFFILFLKNSLYTFACLRKSRSFPSCLKNFINFFFSLFYAWMKNLKRVDGEQCTDIESSPSSYSLHSIIWKFSTSFTCLQGC